MTLKGTKGIALRVFARPVNCPETMVPAGGANVDMILAPPTREGREKVSAMVDAIFVGPASNRRFYLVFFDFLGYAARNDRFADVGATFHEICNGLYAEVIWAGQEEGVFHKRDAREAAIRLSGRCADRGGTRARARGALRPVRDVVGAPARRVRAGLRAQLLRPQPGHPADQLHRGDRF